MTTQDQNTSSLKRKYPTRKYLYFRHAGPIRIMHWINVVALGILLMSGLQIFNAHPSLNWGKSSYNGRPPVLLLRADVKDDGGLVGVTEIFGKPFTTTGFLGASRDADGDLIKRGFPFWLTLPGSQYLAMGRRWHFFFAWVFLINGFLYIAYSVVSRH